MTKNREARIDQNPTNEALNNITGAGDERVRAFEQRSAEAEERCRMMEFELEMKRITASKSGVPSWALALALVLVFVVAGAGAVMYSDALTDTERRITDLSAEKDRTIASLKNELSSANERARQARDEARTAETRAQTLFEQCATEVIDKRENPREAVGHTSTKPDGVRGTQKDNVTGKKHGDTIGEIDIDRPPFYEDGDQNKLNP